MNARLPDVALNTLTEPQAALDGVGMQDVALGLRLPEPGAEQWVNARASVQVDLPDSQRKGIHMSRLYLLLDGFAEQQVLSPLALARLMAALVESHADCGPCHAMPCHAMPCHADAGFRPDAAPAGPGSARAGRLEGLPRQPHG
jgi:GTP cyclohydrolase IB